MKFCHKIFLLRRVFNEIRCKQKNSYRSSTCSLSSLQNNGRMNIITGFHRCSEPSTDGDVSAVKIIIV